jgi:FkbM family methyltransferase
MIKFENFLENGKGIRFSNYSEDVFNIIGKIKDPYTDLCLWKTKMTIYPGIVYFFCCDFAIKNLRFEIFDCSDNSLLLKVDSETSEIHKIEEFDIFGKLKSFSYLDKEVDYSAGAPLISIFIEKEYEKPNCKVEKGEVIFDIGANLGFFSYYSLCKGASKIYCFEPGVSQCLSIRENFGSFENLIIEESAVSDTDGNLDFYYDPESSWVSSLTPQENFKHTSCKSINLNTYIKDKNIEIIDFMKIDCEGEEYKIIESLDDNFLIHKIKKISLEYHSNSGKELYNLVKKLQRCNFIVDLLGNNIYDTTQGMLYAWK